MSNDVVLRNALPASVVADLVARGFRAATRRVTSPSDQVALFVEELVTAVDGRTIHARGDDHQVSVSVGFVGATSAPAPDAETALAVWYFGEQEPRTSARLPTSRLSTRARVALDALRWAYRLSVTASAVEVYVLDREGLQEHPAVERAAVAQLVELAAALESDASLRAAHRALFGN